jgi:hypothetical protein
VRSVCKLLYREGGVQSNLNPLQQLGKPRTPLVANRLVNELRLPTFTMRGNHQSSSHTVYGFRAKILSDNVEAKIDTCRAPG